MTPDDKIYYRIVRTKSTGRLRIAALRDSDFKLFSDLELACDEKFDKIQDARDYAFINIKELVETRHERLADGLADNSPRRPSKRFKNKRPPRPDAPGLPPTDPMPGDK